MKKEMSVTEPSLFSLVALVAGGLFYFPLNIAKLDENMLQEGSWGVVFGPSLVGLFFLRGWCPLCTVHPQHSDLRGAEDQRSLPVASGGGLASQSAPPKVLCPPRPVACGRIEQSRR